MRYALTLEYDGTNYVGFQIQKNAPSIQDKIETALSIILSKKIKILMAGRTDAGVHAFGQVICFDTEKKLEEKNYKIFIQSLNALIPNDIAFYKIQEVAPNFHPRYDCKSREYVYLIWNSTYRSVKWWGKSFWLKKIIDTPTLQAINMDLNYLLGEHNFSALCHNAKAYRNPKRTIYLARFIRDEKDWVSETGEGLLRFEICANAFLHNMIRILIGTLIDIHVKKKNMNLKEILESRDRTKAGSTLTPTGLYFVRANY